MQEKPNEDKDRGEDKQHNKERTPAEQPVWTSTLWEERLRDVLPGTANQLPKTRTGIRDELCDLQRDVGYIGASIPWTNKKNDVP